MNLNQVTISVTDMERSIAFYEALGLRLIVKALPEYARFECTEGGSTFSLHRVTTKAPCDTWVYFERSDLDEYVASLIEQGIPFDELPVDKPWLWREARLNDPDENILILYYAGDNRLHPPWRINH
jgi:catechol 2,3-dioxygenase-like lactoylglutathione lyase family enzyme